MSNSKKVPPPFVSLFCLGNLQNAGGVKCTCRKQVNRNIFRSLFFLLVIVQLISSKSFCTQLEILNLGNNAAKT